MFLYNDIDTFLIMMVGVSGSGKSTRAEDLSIKFNANIYSSDKIRLELFGDNKDVFDKQHNTLVFSELHKRIFDDLKNGKNVIYDATNLRSHNRVDFLMELEKHSICCRKFAFLMDVDYQNCTFQNSKRGEIVPPEVIQRQLVNFEIPSRFEGFEQVILNSLYEKKDGSHLLQENLCPTYNRKKFLKMKKDMKHFDQKNDHHKYNLWKHSKIMAKLCKKEVSYKNIDKFMIFHDIGKMQTRKIKDNGQATYYFHENIGTYFLLLNMDLFKKMSYDDIIDGLYLINHHMLYFSIGNNMKKEKKDLYKYKWFYTSYYILKAINYCDKIASGTYEMER